MSDFDKFYAELVKEEDIVLEEHEAAEDKIINVCTQNNISYNFECLADVEIWQEELMKREHLDVNEEDITTFCNTQMGKQFENKVIKDYENKINERIDTIGNFNKKAFYEDESFVWKVGGRLDGMTSETHRIIEIKKTESGASTHAYVFMKLYKFIHTCIFMKRTIVH